MRFIGIFSCTWMFTLMREHAMLPPLTSFHSSLSVSQKCPTPVTISVTGVAYFLHIGFTATWLQNVSCTVADSDRFWSKVIFLFFQHVCFGWKHHQCLWTAQLESDMKLIKNLPRRLKIWVMVRRTSNLKDLELITTDKLSRNSEKTCKN